MKKVGGEDTDRNKESFIIFNISFEESQSNGNKLLVGLFPLTNILKFLLWIRYCKAQRRIMLGNRWMNVRAPTDMRLIRTYVQTGQNIFAQFFINFSYELLLFFMQSPCPGKINRVKIFQLCSRLFQRKLEPHKGWEKR